MKFCPKCGSLLLPKKENGKKILKCNCGYKNKKGEKIELKEKFDTSKNKIETIEEEVEAMPLTDAECPKCGHKKAYYWMVQTRSSDEAPTKFFKCEKCKKVWRDYD